MTEKGEESLRRGRKDDEVERDRREGEGKSGGEEFRSD